MSEVIVSLLDDEGKLVVKQPFTLEKGHEYKTIGEIMVWLDVELDHLHSL